MIFERFIGAAIYVLEFNLKRFWREYLVGIFALLLWGGLLYGLVLSPPRLFPVGQTITIKKGMALPAIAKQLVGQGVVREPIVFQALIRLANQGGVRAGVYRFTKPADVFTVASRLLEGISGIPTARVTLTEGQTAAEMAVALARVLPEVSQDDFVTAGQPYEGYLFPDTYQFAPESTADTVVAKMRANFNTKIATIQPQITASGHSLGDIVTLASIVEKEARDPADKRIVAGILWKRISMGIPLQVDAVFGYIEGRSEFAPSLAELLTDSPYNTYKHKGLPPGPISNPGLDTLLAAASPQKTNYLYYLTGRDGMMHYAATYAEHQANIKKYLR